MMASLGTMSLTLKTVLEKSATDRSQGCFIAMKKKITKTEGEAFAKLFESAIQRGETDSLIELHCLNAITDQDIVKLRRSLKGLIESKELKWIWVEAPEAELDLLTAQLKLNIPAVGMLATPKMKCAQAVGLSDNGKLFIAMSQLPSVES